ncbi:MAG: D-2-hydroxyacid dehydrogenase, partial [Pseudomonadota bacterium]
DDHTALPGLLDTLQPEVVYSVRFNGGVPFPRDALLNAPSLKWVAVGGSGTDHLMPWDPAQLTVTNAAGVAADMMAEYALGAMLHFSLRIPTFQVAKTERTWLNGTVEPIAGKTVLIVGLGHTGVAVAQRAKALGLTTLGTRARPQATPHVDAVHSPAELPSLWPRADFIVVCVPLLDSTRGLLDQAAFDAMRPTAVIVDVSRGGVIEPDAVLGALQHRRIRGAALDVFATEPLPADNPLWDCDNLLITPHCSSVFDDWYLRSAELFSSNLARYRSGAPLFNVVDPTRGY